MDKEVNWIVAGRFGRVHGIKGFITVHSYTEPRGNILHYTQWHGSVNNTWQALYLTTVEITDKHILVQVDGFHGREEVARLTNVEISVPKETLPELDQGQFYWHELIGMEVINQNKDILGEVVEILPTGSNDVLVIKGKKRVLVPYLPHRTIIDINTLERRIVVEWDPDF